MRDNSSTNKLIILLNLSGSYKGGAQRRYLALFTHLQRQNRKDYYLLLNKSLYNSCVNDSIIESHDNIIVVSFNYDKLSKGNKNINNKKKPDLRINSISAIHTFLGSISGFFKQALGWFDYSLKLRKIIKVYNIGLIYGIFTGGIWSWIIAKLLNIKFIYSYNDASASMINRNILKLFSSEYFCLRYADKVDFLSAGVKTKLKEKGLDIDEERTLISPNSFILYNNFFAEHPKKNQIVFCSRLTKFKNPQLLLEAIILLSRRNFNNFELYILGEGILFQELVNTKNKFDLAHILFKGGVGNTAKYLRTSRIFISIQSDNNYPSQSLLEAMACENAIIASDVGETRKLVTENEGILVSLDAEKIAEAIQYLISNPKECERLGKNARKKALEEHNIEKYSEYFFDITSS